MKRFKIGKSLIVCSVICCLCSGTAFAEESYVSEMGMSNSYSVSSESDITSERVQNIDNAKATTVVWAGNISAQNGIAGFVKGVSLQWATTEDATLRVTLNNSGTNPIRLSVSKLSVLGTPLTIDDVTIQPSQTGTITIDGTELPWDIIGNTIYSLVDIKAVNEKSIDTDGNYSLEEMRGPISGYMTVNLFRN